MIATPSLPLSGILETSRGWGPAFFTKLIFFVRPADDGYIMDQWTGKSVNLLTGKPLVHLSYKGHVTDNTSADDYEEFCKVVEDLANICGSSGGEAEDRLFSHGGRKPGEWRAYVRRHWARPTKMSQSHQGD